MQADTKIIILVGAIMITSKTQFTPRAGQALVNEFYNSKLKGSTFCKQKIFLTIYYNIGGISVKAYLKHLMLNFCL
jgi:hypothetical protein